MKTLEKTRAHIPAGFAVVPRQSETWQIWEVKNIKHCENFSILDYRGPYGTLELILDYGLRW